MEQFYCNDRPFLHRIFDLGRIVCYIEDNRHGLTLCYNEGYIVVILEVYCDSFVLSIHYIVAMSNLQYIILYKRRLFYQPLQRLEPAQFTLCSLSPNNVFHICRIIYIDLCGINVEIRFLFERSCELFAILQ